MKNKKLSLYLAGLLALSVLPSFTACDSGETVLRIASWEEYIDEGGDESYVEGSKSMIEDFEAWYEKTYHENIRVVYIPLSDNEQMYAKIDKFNRHYDLLCPSEYMFMKLADEGILQKYPESFFDKTIEENYYAKNVTPYIKEVFDSHTINGVKWSEYAAGYMWGTTGFIYNSEKVNAEDVKSWNVYFNKNYSISAKNNVRDSYFAGLGMYYENELLSLRDSYLGGVLSQNEYKATLASMMNETKESTMDEVEKLLKKMKKQPNFWGFETDNAKSYLISGDIDVSYQWSGDAVYIMDEAESESLRHPIRFDYCVPESASNLWFDGWVMMKGANVKAATAFVNFISRPDNVIRNMYYIGYTSCVGGAEVFDYINETYGVDESEGEYYDLTKYFPEFGGIYADPEQFTRQLFAQYPTQSVLERCAIMNYFSKEVNTRANKLWKDVSGS